MPVPSDKHVECEESEEVCDRVCVCVPRFRSLL